MNVLPVPVRVRVLSALVEGCSIRATERLTGVHRDTVMRLGVQVGDGCRRLHDALVRNLYGSVYELDELWAFVHTKAGHVRPTDPPEWGDAYTFTALDADSKLYAAYRTGPRDGVTAKAFALDLRARVLGKPQLTSDGFKPYLEAVEEAFGSRVHYAQLIKHYDGPDEGDAARRYPPGEIIDVEKRVITGSPDAARISTSYIERSNLTVRMSQRRFTRLTNAFSKTLRNLRAAVSLYVAHYNLCRVHMTLRVTPAMAAQLTNRVWSMEELLDAALSALEYVAPEPDPAAVANGPVGRVMKAGAMTLRVLPGGRAGGSR